VLVGAKSLSQARAEPWIPLDRDHSRSARPEGRGNSSSASADVEHEITSVYA